MAGAVGAALAVLALAAWAAVAVARARKHRARALAGQALHELRRPLQALALIAEEGVVADQLAIATDALADLESVLLGKRPDVRARRVSIRPVVEAAVERWRHTSSAGVERDAVELVWRAGEARAIVDPRRLGQALDNLIANALEHGLAPVTVEASRSASGLRLSVRNPLAEPKAAEAARPDDEKEWRGHGLHIVSAIATAHGGRFLFDCARGWAVGTLELPLARPLAEAAATS